MDNITLGSASMAFLTSPAKVATEEFWGIAFVIVVLAIYWSHFVNDLDG